MGNSNKPLFYVLISIFFFSFKQFNYNQLSNFNELNNLSHSPKLNTLFLQGNPIDKDPQYRNKVIILFPALTSLDSVDVVRNTLVKTLSGVKE